MLERLLLASIGGSLLIVGLACGPDRDQRATIEAAIKHSDSLRRQATRATAPL